MCLCFKCPDWCDLIGSCHYSNALVLHWLELSWKSLRYCVRYREGYRLRYQLSYSNRIRLLASIRVVIVVATMHSKTDSNLRRIRVYRYNLKVFPEKHSYHTPVYGYYSQIKDHSVQVLLSLENLDHLWFWSTSRNPCLWRPTSIDPPIIRTALSELRIMGGSVDTQPLNLVRGRGSSSPRAEKNSKTDTGISTAPDPFGSNDWAGSGP